MNARTFAFVRPILPRSISTKNLRPLDAVSEAVNPFAVADTVISGRAGSRSVSTGGAADERVVDGVAGQLRVADDRDRDPEENGEALPVRPLDLSEHGVCPRGGLHAYMIRIVPPVFRCRLRCSARCRARSNCVLRTLVRECPRERNVD